MTAPEPDDEPPAAAARGAAAAAGRRLRAAAAFSAEDARRGATMLAAVALLLPIALGLPNAAASWPTALALFSSVAVIVLGAACPCSAGEAALALRAYAVGSAVGAAVAAAHVGLLYAAAPGPPLGAPSAAKAAVLGVAAPAAAAAVHLARARLPAWEGGLRLAQIAIGVTAFGLFWAPPPIWFLWAGPWLCAAFLCLGPCAAIIVTALVVPAPAGAAARGALAALLAAGAAQFAAVVEMLAELRPAAGAERLVRQGPPRGGAAALRGRRRGRALALRGRRPGRVRGGRSGRLPPPARLPGRRLPRGLPARARL
jgi:hypothetical protein